MESDPYVSAVVLLRSSVEADPAGPVAEDPAGVVSEVASILGGTGGGPAVPEVEHHSTHHHPPPAGQSSLMARAKGHFTRAGFEVHAPFGNSFSIGGRKSQFERFFDRPLVIDEERLGGPVTTAEGERSLPVERLDAEVREMVESIAFPPPPDFGV